MKQETPEAKAARLAKAAATRAANKKGWEERKRADAAAAKANKDRAETIRKLGAVTVERGASEAEAAKAKAAIARLKALKPVSFLDKMAAEHRPPPMPESLAGWDRLRKNKTTQQPPPRAESAAKPAPAAKPAKAHTTSDRTAADYEAEIADLKKQLAAARGFKQRNCVVCGKPFTASRPEAKTCSVRCRVTLHRKK
jgi:hypothetical protein